MSGLVLNLCVCGVCVWECVWVGVCVCGWECVCVGGSVCGWECVGGIIIIRNH